MAATTESPPVTPSSPVSSPTVAGPGPELSASARPRARESTARAAHLGLAKVRAVTGTGMLSAVPKSVAWQITYAKAGGWVPGERAWWLEWFGKAYGFAIAVPITALGFLAIWCTQRPTRVALLAALWFAVRWAL